MSNVFDKYQKGATPSNVGVAVDDTNVFSKYQKGATPSNVGVAVDDTNVFLKYQGTMRRPQEPAQPAQPAQPTGFGATVKNIFSDIATGIKKLIPRTAVEGANLLSSTLDFAADLVANRIEKAIRSPPQAKAREGSPLAASFDQKKATAMADKWANFYETTVGKKTEDIKKFTQTLREKENIRPTEEWSNATLAEKFKPDKLFETIFNIGPGIVASLGTFAISIPAGFVVSAGAVADDVKSSAIEWGVDEEDAERLGLGTGLLVGAIDKIVPDELFSPQEKAKFMSGVAKRLVKTAVKEAGTEVVQEDIQLIAEKTFREDLGWDEVKARNAMSALGGLLGGTGAQMAVNFTNQVREGNIGSSEVTVAEAKSPAEGRAEITTLADDNVFAKYQPATAEAVVAPVEKKPVKVTPVKKKAKPAPLEPVGVGKKKVSTLGLGIEAKAIVSNLTGGFDALPEYKQLSVVNQAKKADALIKTDFDKAVNIARGLEAPPKGLLSESVLVAVENKALEDGSVELLRQLASSDLVSAGTAMGQRIRLLGERNPDSPVARIQEVMDVRREVLEKKTKTTTKKEVTKIKESVATEVKKIKRGDWTSFINSIEC